MDLPSWKMLSPTIRFPPATSFDYLTGRAAGWRTTRSSFVVSYLSKGQPVRARCVSVAEAVSQVLQSALETDPDAPNAEQLSLAILSSNDRSLKLEAMLRESSAPQETERPPRRPLDTFYVLSRLAASIQGEGSWITPQLYLPAELWHDLSNVSDIPAKVNGLNSILEKLQTAQRKLEYKHNPAEVLSALQRALKPVRKDLARDLSYVREEEELPEAKEGWSFGAWTRSISESISTKTSSAASVGGGAAYVQLLAQLCTKIALWHPAEQTSPFWQLQGTGDTQGSQQALEHLSEFLREVVCTIALHDVRKLYSRFLKREKKVFDVSHH